MLLNNRYINSVTRYQPRLRGTISKINQYKIRQLEREVYHGELHKESGSFTQLVALGGGFSEHGITNIAQGDAINMRTGHRITIRGLQINVHKPAQNVDCYLILSANGDTPIAADFHNVIGGFLTITGMGSHKILANIRNYQGANYYSNLNMRFKKGLDVRWNSSTTTDISKNRLSIVFSNHSSAAVTVDCSYILYWTDK